MFRRTYSDYGPVLEIGRSVPPGATLPDRTLGVSWLPIYPGVWSIEFYRTGGYRVARFGRLRLWAFWQYARER